MTKLRPLILFPVALLLALIVACGGDKASSNSSGSSSSSSSSSSAGAGTLDLNKTAANLADLKSFRFDMNMKLDLGAMPTATAGNDAMGDAFAALLFGLVGDIKASGAFVKPDQTEVSLTLGGQQLGFVQIGQKAWVKMGSSWQATDASDAMGMGSPTDMLGDFLPPEVLKGAKTSQETVNGVKTTHYSFDKKALESLMTDLSAGDFADVTKANLDAWISSDNIPVKIAMDIEGKDESGKKVGLHLDVSIKDVNSSDIKIKAPI